MGLWKRQLSSQLLWTCLGRREAKFLLALGVMLCLGGMGGFLPGLGGPPGEALCFIPWAVLINCINQACTGPASKSSCRGTWWGRPWRARHWPGHQTVDVRFWSNGVIDAPRLWVEVVSMHQRHHLPKACQEVLCLMHATFITSV